MRNRVLQQTFASRFSARQPLPLEAQLQQAVRMVRPQVRQMQPPVRLCAESPPVRGSHSKKQTGDSRGRDSSRCRPRAKAPSQEETHAQVRFYLRWHLLRAFRLAAHMVYGCQESAEKEATAHVNAHCAVQGHCFLALCAQLCPCIGQDQCSSDRQCGYKRQLRCRSRSRFTLAQALHSKVLCNLTAGRGVPVEWERPRCTEDWNPWHACRVGEASQPGPSWPVAICEPIELPGDDSVDPVIQPMARSLRVHHLVERHLALAACSQSHAVGVSLAQTALTHYSGNANEALCSRQCSIIEYAQLGSACTLWASLRLVSSQ